MTLTHRSDCAARAVPCGCGLEGRFKTMVALLSIDLGKACGVLSNHGLAPELVDAAMRNVHRVETGRRRWSGWRAPCSRGATPTSRRRRAC